MDLSRLTAKNKRYLDWLRYTNEELNDPSLRAPTLTLLEEFRTLIQRCWTAGKVTDQDSAALADLERRLEQLNQEARVRVVGRQHP
jgi:hypothetical protein